MPIKRRRTTKTYDDFRAERWKMQGGGDDYNFRGSKHKDGSPLTFPVLQPRTNPHYKDFWHCPTPREARGLARLILEFGNVNYLQLKGTWLSVDYADNGEWQLPGQKLD